MPDQKKADDDASIALMSKRFKKVAEVIGTEKAVAVLNACSASRQDPRFGEAIFPVWGNVSPFWGMCLTETLLVGCLSSHPTLSSAGAVGVGLVSERAYNAQQAGRVNLWPTP